MRKLLTVAVTAAAAAVLASGTGLAVAATHHDAPARPAASGTEHFQLMSDNNSNRDALVASGAFTAGGVDIQGKGNVDLVKLPGGTFKITHRQTGGTQHFNPRTCLMVIKQTAGYMLSDGTGRYAGISGSGTATVNGIGVGGRNHQGRCRQNAAPQAFELVINASGPVRVP